VAFGSENLLVVFLILISGVDCGQNDDGS